MSIQSIRIENLLSFDNLIINNLEDVNCIIGQNNAGKSNLLKLLRFFYLKLEGQRAIPPELNSRYSAFGSIAITYDTQRIFTIVTSKNNNSKFFKHIYNTLFFKNSHDFLNFARDRKGRKIRSLRNPPPFISKFELTLKIHNNDAIEWSENKDVRSVINFLYPFFDVETRHINLYDWDKLWYIISRLNTFDVNQLNNEDVIDFFDSKISEKNSSYKNHIDKIKGIIDTSKYSYREKVLNYIKVGLDGHSFTISGEKLDYQSDGTNSHKYLDYLLKSVIILSRRSYISPTVYIDEPEIGLHPKRNEELISKKIKK